MVLAKIAENETREGKNEEQASRNGIELPSLRKRIAHARFNQIGNAADDEVQDKEFEKAQPQGFGPMLESHDCQYAFIDKREVGGNRRQQNHEPA